MTPAKRPPSRRVRAAVIVVVGLAFALAGLAMSHHRRTGKAAPAAGARR